MGFPYRNMKNAQSFHSCSCALPTSTARQFWAQPPGPAASWGITHCGAARCPGAVCAAEHCSEQSLCVRCTAWEQGELEKKCSHVLINKNLVGILHVLFGALGALLGGGTQGRQAGVQRGGLGMGCNVLFFFVADGRKTTEVLDQQ